MANRGKGEKEKEKAKWQLALDLQEKKLLDGIKDAFSSISNNLKSFLHLELKELKNEISDIRKDLQAVTHKIEQVKLKTTKKEVEKLKEQNKSLQASIVMLECKPLDNCLRLRGVVAEKGEDITETIGLLAKYLGEQIDVVAFNLDTVYRVNSHLATQNQLPRDIVVRFRKMKEDIFAKSFKDPLEGEGKTIRTPEKSNGR